MTQEDMRDYVAKYQIIEDDVAELAEVDVVLKLRRTLVKVEDLDVVESLFASLAGDILGLSLRPLGTRRLRAPLVLNVISGLDLELKEALYRVDL